MKNTLLTAFYFNFCDVSADWCDTKTRISNNMTRPRVFVTRSVHQEAIDHLKEKCEVDIWDSDQAVPRNELLKRVKGVAGIFCTISDNIDVEVLDAAGSSLKIVATMSVGTHHISTFECRKRDIYVATTPDVAADSAAEFTVTLLLMVARRCLEGPPSGADEELHCDPSLGHQHHKGTPGYGQEHCA
ncbi:glyoxylate reductase/hydroxypyruvate reductase [Elysia marginata]|uniref:Glyoxylate reductase/hydroxypyruvate reductase n=1 Tax=Elysia marginata TaxID=1093978 RepID=A0AAV4F9E3_9GAST|nr:glyoxylate reductase/hydroxypyruvate reductase [Elysia marginata]